MEHIPEYESISSTFDLTPKTNIKKKKYIPPMNHPWKSASYKKYQERMPHLKKANV